MCGFLSLMLAAAVVAAPRPRNEQEVFWAGSGFWDRRHAAKLQEIAAGSGEYDLVFLGDSITHNWEGWRDSIDRQTVARAFAAGRLKMPDAPGLREWNRLRRHYRVLNLGMGGDTVSLLLWRLQNGALDGYRTRCFVLMIGTNDSGPAEEVIVGIRAILEEIRRRQPRARVVLLPIFPREKAPDSPVRRKRDGINAEIKTLADGKSVLWLDFNRRFLTPEGVLTEDVMPDLLHPKEDGYRIWREELEAVLPGFLGSRPPVEWTGLLLDTADCLKGEADRKEPAYAIGEEIVFRVRLGGFQGVRTDGFVLAWERTADDGIRETGKAPIDGNEFIYRTRLDRPGFVRLKGTLLDSQGKIVKRMASWGNLQPVECDLGAGVAIDEIRTAVPTPKDFTAFWEQRRQILAKIPMTGTELDKVVEDEAIRIYAVKCPCAGPRPVTGFLSVPRVAETGRRFPATAAFHGYNASWTASAWGRPSPASFPKDRLQFVVSAHGFELMRDPSYYAELRALVKSGGYDYAFDPAQNADPDTAYFSGMSYRVMRALEYLKSRPEWDGKNLCVTGGSMGGMQSVWGASLDSAVTECTVFTPWNCDIGGTEAGRNRGDWFLKWVPALGYYDTANHAARIQKTCRVNVFMAGLGDYLCPPTGVMAFYNALRTEKEIVFRQNARHGDFLQPDSRQCIRLKSSGGRK